MSDTKDQRDEKIAQLSQENSAMHQTIVALRRDLDRMARVVAQLTLRIEGTGE